MTTVDAIKVLINVAQAACKMGVLSLPDARLTADAVDACILHLEAEAKPPEAAP